MALGFLFPHLCVHLRHLRTISAVSPSPQDHALTDRRQSPLMGELVAVLLEQPLGVDAVSLKRPAALLFSAVDPPAQGDTRGVDLVGPQPRRHIYRDAPSAY